jgi:hypothetical protein
MAQNSQVGTNIYTKSAPSFTGYIVVGGSWSESDALKIDNAENQDESIFNTTGWDPGLDAKCQLLALGQTTYPQVLDVIAEVSPSTRKWMVKKVDKKFAKRKVMFDVELQFRASQDLTIVS